MHASGSGFNWEENWWAITLARCARTGRRASALQLILDNAHPALHPFFHSSEGEGRQSRHRSTDFACLLPEMREDNSISMDIRQPRHVDLDVLCDFFDRLLGIDAQLPEALLRQADQTQGHAAACQTDDERSFPCWNHRSQGVGNRQQQEAQGVDGRS